MKRMVLCLLVLLFVAPAVWAQASSPPVPTAPVAGPVDSVGLNLPTFSVGGLGAALGALVMRLLGTWLGTPKPVPVPQPPAPPAPPANQLLELILKLLAERFRVSLPNQLSQPAGPATAPASVQPEPPTWQAELLAEIRALKQPVKG